MNSKDNDKITSNSLDLSKTVDELFNSALENHKSNRFDEAERGYAEALSIYRALSEGNPSAYTPDVATTLNNLAILHGNTGRMEEAAAEYMEALTTYRALANENSSAYTPYVAMTLDNLAILHSNTGRVKEAEAEYTEALKIRRALVIDNPSAYTPDVAKTLNNLANLHSDTGRMEEAEAEYTEALKIRRALAIDNPSAYTPDVAVTLNNLGALHGDTGRLGEAEDEFAEALEKYRALATENPSVYLPYLIITLDGSAELYEKRGSFEKEFNFIFEALNRSVEISQTSDNLYFSPLGNIRDYISKLRARVEDRLKAYLENKFSGKGFSIKADAEYSYSSGGREIIGHVDYLIFKGNRPFSVIELGESIKGRTDIPINDMSEVLKYFGAQYAIVILDFKNCKFFSESRREEYSLDYIIRLVRGEEKQSSHKEIVREEALDKVKIIGRLQTLLADYNKEIQSRANFITPGVDKCTIIDAGEKQSLANKPDDIKEFTNSLKAESIDISEDGKVSLIAEEEDKFFLALLGKGNKLYRYTSLNSLFLTLKDARHPMCHIRCMNDPLEAKYADEQIKNIRKNKETAEEESADNGPKSQNNGPDAYIISCSECFDDLTMWRLYGDDAKGVCIQYSVGDVNPPFYLAKVSYASSDGSHRDLELIQRIMDGDIVGSEQKFVFRNWSVWKHFFKPKEYAVEKEVRILYIPPQSGGEGDDNKEWIIDRTNGIVSPMLIFKMGSGKFPLMIGQIILGCKVRQPILNKEQLRELAGEHENTFKSMQITTSTIRTYR